MPDSRGRDMHNLLLALALTAIQPIELEIDLREAPRRLVHARMTIPARPGPLVLVYPKWIQGEHAPVGPLADVVGLRVAAGGKTLPWVRDAVDLHAVRVQVPPGADRVEVALDHAPASNFTPNLGMFNWSSAILYPRGKPRARSRSARRWSFPRPGSGARRLPPRRKRTGASSSSLSAWRRLPTRRSWRAATCAVSPSARPRVRRTR